VRIHCKGNKTPPYRTACNGVNRLTQYRDLPDLREDAEDAATFDDAHGGAPQLERRQAGQSCPSIWAP
jgi:hypothetical protein